MNNIRTESVQSEPIPDILARIGTELQNGGVRAPSLPFAAGDTTAGTETELQAAVAGQRGDVDLPLAIEESVYFAAIARRAAAGEAPRSAVSGLERFLSRNREQVWENSWVRFPRRMLSPFADRVFTADLRANKSDLASGERSDAGRFIALKDGEQWLRLPVSYLIKLALADAAGTSAHPAIRATGERLMGHFLNDNTSPETFSFHVVTTASGSGPGKGVAREKAIRYLLTQLLIMYANTAFGLSANGQRAMVYLAPHPPVRQKELNGLIADSFYRDLFMSPCLSGWDRGEEKHRYMHLCHQVLSRSRLNTVAKLRDAGIIQNNLVVLPSVSDVSLANNGTHLSLGSLRLGAALDDPSSGFTPHHEKHLGDLVIKATEHFLPLFVGTYTAAPYRLGFTDFHPERALGFLPHELDYTHLRMLWRRWRKKARLSFFGNVITPFGPEWLDRSISRLFGLTGDVVPDFRLIDYLVSLLSTTRSPALDGRVGNGDRLRRDLAELGIFDAQMSVYLLCKLREKHVVGFSGFEGRHYSLFESFEDDLGGAADLQNLVILFAYKLMAEGKLSHRDIPDNPVIESERRQIFFAAAMGVPTIYIRRATRNRLLRSILERTDGSRQSRRYPGYLRVRVEEYRRALVRTLMTDGADLIEMLGMKERMEELTARLELPDRLTAAGRLTRGILAGTGTRSAMATPAADFNRGAESFYRQGLRFRHLSEALDMLEERLTALDRQATEGDSSTATLLADLTGGGGGASYLRRVRRDLLDENLPAESLRTVIALVIASIANDTEHAAARINAHKVRHLQ
ncbi:hypothetical protein [Geobacter metallireducens]|uniref:hypothetical protein n=1 Tax=Geobacter metallireducens TaxID=28232 RepID=UPI00003C6DF2|nr:hypothetical protein [Geobacter metallireducens]